MSSRPASLKPGVSGSVTPSASPTLASDGPPPVKSPLNAVRCSGSVVVPSKLSVVLPAVADSRTGCATAVSPSASSDSAPVVRSETLTGSF